MTQPRLWTTGPRSRAQTVNVEWARLRDRMQAQTGADFRVRASARIMAELVLNPCGLSGEQLTLRCREAGIMPPGGDDRHFGPVYAALSRAKLIRKAGSAPRLRGHGTSGGTLWVRA